MSVASILVKDSGIEEIYFDQINCSVLNASVINASTINGGGGGGGGSTTVTNTDGTITVANSAGTYTVSFGNQIKGTLNCNSHDLNAVNGIQFIDNTVSGQTLTVQNYNNKLNVIGSTGSSGIIFDTHYNPVTFSDVLSTTTNNSAMGANITNVGSLTASALYVSASPSNGTVYDSVVNKPILSVVLGLSGNAGAQSITNLSSLAVGSITCTTINGHTPNFATGAIQYLRGYNKTYNVSSVGTTSDPFTLAQISNAGLSDGNYFEMYFDFMEFNLSNGNSNGYSAQLYLSQTNDGLYNSSTGNFYAINDGVTGVLNSVNNMMLNFAGSTGVSQLYLVCVFTSTVSTPGTSTINFNGSIKVMNCTAGTF